MLLQAAVPSRRRPRNADNDLESPSLLIAQRWRVLTVWECALKGKAKLPFESMVTLIVEWIESDVESLEIVGPWSVRSTTV